MKYNIHKIYLVLRQLFAIFLILFGVYFLNYTYQQNNNNKVEKLPTSSYLNNDIIQYCNFGFRNILSDYFWLATVQYIGKHVIDDDYKYLNNYFRITTMLDTHFVYAYKTNLMILSDYKLEDSIKIAKKGMYYNYDSWSIPFYLGYIYGFVSEKAEMGAAYFDIAKTKPNVLKSAHYLGPALRRNAGQLETTLLFWYSVLKESNDNEDLKKAKLEIERIKNMIYLKKVCLAFYKKFNSHVDFYMQDLISYGFLDKLPNDPAKNIIYGWDKNDQKVKIVPK